MLNPQLGMPADWPSPVGNGGPLGEVPTAGLGGVPGADLRAVPAGEFEVVFREEFEVVFGKEFKAVSGAGFATGEQLKTVPGSGTNQDLEFLNSWSPSPDGQAPFMVHPELDGDGGGGSQYPLIFGKWCTLKRDWDWDFGPFGFIDRGSRYCVLLSLFGRQSSRLLSGGKILDSPWSSSYISKGLFNPACALTPC